ncbi:MAG: FG-GAP repeat protein [Proteobacteria bacterium]|nr:FG-GAP repeat protein [Pseudomonadota bacterium]
MRILPALVFLCACCWAMAATAAPPASLDAALARLQGGDAAGAARDLESLTRSGLRSAEAFGALGNAYQQLHEHRRAIEAYQSALAVDADAPRIFYALGSSYAASGDAEQAFAWLARARASRRIDMTRATQDKNLDSLRSDARFARLLPTPADFDDPFVEPVRVLREWRGEAANDQFGWIARNLGDVDGDGVADVVVSAPTHGADSSNAGRIYVYSTGRDALLWTADGRAGEQLGTGVEAAGDTDGDGIPDVVASGPGLGGVARIYSGRDGHVLHEFRAPRPDETFGNHAAGAGDVDGDGHADIIVGSPGKDGEHKSPGHAYVYSGRTGALLLALHGERNGDQFGSTVAGFSDGRQQWLVVGAPLAGPAHHGRAYVYAGPAHRLQFTIDADATGNALGLMFVSLPGDMDGDGVSEVFASDWSNAAHGFSTGRVYVYSGRTGRLLHSFTGEHPGDGFGTSASVAGDIDGDGRADLVVGAWQYGGAAVSGGRAYLYSGRDGRLLASYTCRTPGDTFGFDAAGLGVVQPDGTTGLLITSGWSGVNGFHSGRVFVLASGFAAPAAARQPGG